MSDFAVIFTEGNARLKYGDLSAYRGKPNVLINPKIPSGVPPHLWCIRDGEIALKSDVIAPASRRDYKFILLVAGYALSMLAGYLIGRL